MGAGLAGSMTKKVNINQVQFGNKLQGLAPSATQFFIQSGRGGGNNYQTRADGDKRNVVFCMNQLGGVGRAKSQFKIDGVNHPDGARKCDPWMYIPESKLENAIETLRQLLATWHPEYTLILSGDNEDMQQELARCCNTYTVNKDHFINISAPEHLAKFPKSIQYLISGVNHYSTDPGLWFNQPNNGCQGVSLGQHTLSLLTKEDNVAQLLQNCHFGTTTWNTLRVYAYNDEPGDPLFYTSPDIPVTLPSGMTLAAVVVRYYNLGATGKDTMDAFGAPQLCNSISDTRAATFSHFAGCNYVLQNGYGFADIATGEGTQTLIANNAISNGPFWTVSNTGGGGWDSAAVYTAWEGLKEVFKQDYAYVPTSVNVRGLAPVTGYISIVSYYQTPEQASPTALLTLKSTAKDMTFYTTGTVNGTKGAEGTEQLVDNPYLGSNLSILAYYDRQKNAYSQQSPGLGCCCGGSGCVATDGNPGPDLYYPAGYGDAVGCFPPTGLCLGPCSGGGQLWLTPLQIVAPSSTQSTIAVQMGGTPCMDDAFDYSLCSKLPLSLDDSEVPDTACGAGGTPDGCAPIYRLSSVASVGDKADSGDHCADTYLLSPGIYLPQANFSSVVPVVQTDFKYGAFIMRQPTTFNVDPSIETAGTGTWDEDLNCTFLSISSCMSCPGALDPGGMDPDAVNCRTGGILNMFQDEDRFNNCPCKGKCGYIPSTGGPACADGGGGTCCCWTSQLAIVPTDPEYSTFGGGEANSPFWVNSQMYLTQGVSLLTDNDGNKYMFMLYAPLNITHSLWAATTETGTGAYSCQQSPTYLTQSVSIAGVDETIDAYVLPAPTSVWTIRYRDPNPDWEGSPSRVGCRPDQFCEASPDQLGEYYPRFIQVEGLPGASTIDDLAAKLTWDPATAELTPID